MRNLIFQIILKNIEIYQDFSGGFLKYLEKLEFHYKVYVFIFNYKIFLIFNFYMWILTVWYSYNVYLINNWFLNISEICFKFLHPEDILWFYLKYHKIFQYFLKDLRLLFNLLVIALAWGVFLASWFVKYWLYCICFFKWCYWIFLT